MQRGGAGGKTTWERGSYESRHSGDRAFRRLLLCEEDPIVETQGSEVSWEWSSGGAGP